MLDAGWTGVTSGTVEALNGVWGSGPADVWAVGGGGMIVHWNGSAWATQSSPTSDPLKSVWGSGPNEKRPG